MENAIKKSLLDKNVESFVYNPNLVINNQEKNIKEKILELLSKSTRVDIAVSYVVWSGLSLIYNELTKLDENSRILITTDGMVTDPRSLEKLLNLKAQTKVYVPNNNSKGFHLKTYLFENNEKNILLVGSSNISARAFGLTHEMAVEIDANKEGFIVEEYNDIFDNLWKDENSIIIDEEFINGYKQIYKDQKQINQILDDSIFKSEKIKPNYMQEKALIELEQTRLTSDRGLIIAATGTGKTYLSAFDVKNSGAKKVLFLVHNRLILTSAINTYEKIFPGFLLKELSSMNIDDVYNFDILFTTDKTAFSYLIKKVPRDYFDYIIYDEAHKIGEDTKYSELIEYFKPKFTLGMTATPERTDNPEYLFKTFKYSIPYEIRLLDAMNRELVCPFTYYGFNLEEKLLDVDEKFNYGELANYLQKIINEKGHYGEKLQCLVFCSDISEAKNISNKLNEIGYKSVAAVSGENDDREIIEKYIKDLKSNLSDSLEIICTVNKFNEGIDIPDINTIIMLRNTTSSIIYLQQLGRGLRKTNDENKYVTIFDIIGNSKNNYSIAQVLTGNSTFDKRKLYMYANKEFNTISPFINVYIEKQAMDNIISSISNNFTVKTKLKEKYKNELYRFKEIPRLLDLYLNPNFNELDLLQLLFKNFYDPFEEYYLEKYYIPKENKFLSNFFTLITQFIFRAYNNNTLKDYAKLLSGGKINNKTLKRILMASELDDGISTAINSEYNKVAYNNPKPVLLDYLNEEFYINPEIIKKLSELNAIELYKEHIELIKYLSNDLNYSMKTFDLVNKGEFLFNVKAKDCYMNVVGERIDKDKKTVYCTIKITEKESHYDNYIVDNNKIVYYTQSSNTKEQAEAKIKMLFEEKYTFYICAQFPHLGYSNTSYFNLGNVKINKIFDVELREDGKYNHKIEFILENKLPEEFLQYKTR